MVISPFDADFQRLVVPKLVRRDRRIAPGIALRRWAYSRALDSLLREALRLGAAHLPDTDFYDLEDYLAGRLADFASTALEETLKEEF